MDILIFEKVKSFVKEDRWACSIEDLKPSTRIKQDLGIKGADAYEFLDVFVKRFGIDASNFDFNEYFEPEGDNILFASIRSFFGKKEKSKKVLTLGDLENAIRFKVLK
jgi:hypothetical protein